MKYFLLSICICYSLFAGDYGKVSGIIYDIQTKQPIENVNIYIAKSTIGASSNTDGKFLINSIPPGRYTLILSHLAYKNKEYSLDIRNNKTIELTFRLEPKPIQFPEIDVTDKPDDKWEEQFEIFREGLLGSSWFADGCEIKNPYFISFEESEEGILYAACDVPIKIENRSLGYNISYILEHFEYNFDTTKYAGFPFFKEMESELEEDHENWRNNRLEAYMGSVRHFLRSLSDFYSLIKSEELDQQNYEEYFNKHGFVIYRNKLFSTVYGRRWVQEELNPYSILAPAKRVNELLIVCEDELYIEYLKEYQEFNYEPQISFIKFHADSVYFDKRGRYHDGFMLQTMGYMYKQRLAEMLPFEYEPSDSLIFSTDFR